MFSLISNDDYTKSLIEEVEYCLIQGSIGDYHTARLYLDNLHEFLQETKDTEYVDIKQRIDFAENMYDMGYKNLVRRLSHLFNC